MQSELEEKRIKLKEECMTQGNIPRFSKSNATNSIKKENNLDDRFTCSDFQKWIGKDKNNVNIWRKTVENEYDKKWRHLSEELKPTESSDTDSADNEKLMLRTATTTMKQILRPDLLNHYGTIIQTLTLKQAIITDTMDELAILAHKTTLLVSCEL